MRSDVIEPQAGRETSRRHGWLAAELRLPIAAPSPLIAVGAESKGAFCLVEGDRALLSESFGSLLEPDNYRRYRAALDVASIETGVSPRCVAYDLHPGYLSTAYAHACGLPSRPVQHHHAHVAACMIEHGRCEPVIGIVCDGAGCGLDKASWGCEILRVEPRQFERLAHLRYFRLPGSDKSATQCWRPAYAICRDAFGGNFSVEARSLFDEVGEDDLRIADQMLSGNVQSPLTSSLGRLFDVASYLLGLCRQNEHEAQAAIALETAATATPGIALPFAIDEGDGATILDMTPAVRELIRRRQDGAATEQLAADFHETLVQALTRLAVDEASRCRLNTVVLTGGCFANRLLARGLADQLCGAGLKVLEHRMVSCGDAAIPLGQAYVAAALEAAECGGE